MAFLPSTSTCCSAPSHHHGRPGHWVGPAEIGGDLDVSHLAAAAFTIVVAVLALAVRSHRARVIDVMPKLSDIFDDHIHAVRIAFAQMPSGGVVGALSAEPRYSG